MFKQSKLNQTLTKLQIKPTQTYETVPRRYAVKKCTSADEKRTEATISTISSSSSSSLHHINLPLPSHANLTVCLIKPHAYQQASKILIQLQHHPTHALDIVQSRTITFTSELISRFYNDYARPWQAELLEMMTTGPSMALLLSSSRQNEAAFATLRKVVCGPTQRGHDDPMGLRYIYSDPRRPYLLNGVYFSYIYIYIYSIYIYIISLL